MIAIGTAIVTVAGVAYGADNPKNLNETLSYSIKISFLISIVMVAIMFIFSPQIALLFSYTEASSNLAPQSQGHCQFYVSLLLRFHWESCLQ